MYDGVLLTGNAYYNGNTKPGDSINREWDYANSAWKGTADKGHVYDTAKYKNMNNVTANILKDGVKWELLTKHLKKLTGLLLKMVEQELLPHLEIS